MDNWFNSRKFMNNIQIFDKMNGCHKIYVYFRFIRTICRFQQPFSFPFTRICSANRYRVGNIHKINDDNIFCPLSFSVLAPPPPPTLCRNTSHWHNGPNSIKSHTEPAAAKALRLITPIKPIGLFETEWLAQ